MIKKILYIMSLSLTLVSCANDDIISSQEDNQVIDILGGDLSLIGTAVNFQPYTDGYSTRANGTWLHDGQFNTGDLMYIYRQFYESNTWTYKTPPGTLYKYIDKYNGVTGIFDKSSWKPFENKWFCFSDPTYSNEDTDTNLSTTTKKKWNGSSWELDTHSYSKKLTASDSIVWESGKTVRFRAWILNNLGNNLADPSTNKPGITTINYPDYLVCDWVTVAGPTEQIPMAMRHLGCRFAFSPYDWNVFTQIQICTEEADYAREDNADSTPGADDADKIIKDENGKIITAAEAAANVKKVYDKMCWPAGVDVDDMSLMICSKDNTETKYLQKQQTSEFIATSVKRPVFHDVSSTSRWYMITTPYDMSKEGTYGEPLHLPPYTRFKIRLRDVNNADSGENGNSGSENEFHIFSLSDIKNSDGIAKYNTGIDLKAGNSYLFYVGYKHNKLEVWAADYGMSWEEQDMAESPAADERAPYAETDRYKWYTDAITAACEATKTSGAYQPEFTISSENELIEFIRLVNGEFKKGPAEGPLGTSEGAITNDKPLKKKVVTNDNGTREVKWYKYSEDSPIAKSILEEEGYIFYDSYTPAIGTQPSVIEEDYLKEPFSFYNEQVGRRWVVKLSKDLDLRDYSLESIGINSTYFAGHFNGQGYTIKNIYCPNAVLFNTVKDGTISNLKLESTYPLSLVYKCTNERILGISIKAPSTYGSLAEEARGTCYFVGCIHEGDSEKPLVELGERVYMYGCMQAAYNTNGDKKPALIYADGTNLDNGVGIISEMNDARNASYPWWGGIACNYYDTDLWNGAKAIQIKDFKWSGGGKYSLLLPRRAYFDTTTSDYKYDDNPITAITDFSSLHRKQYIRGVPTHIMCAKTDFLIDAQTKWASLTILQRTEIYGVAPWKAMNYAIYRYNDGLGSDSANKPFRCVMHYEVNNTGFDNRYPKLLTAEPTSTQYINVMNEFN